MRYLTLLCLASHKKNLGTSDATEPSIWTGSTLFAYSKARDMALCLKFLLVPYTVWLYKQQRLKQACACKSIQMHRLLIWTASSEFGTYRLCEQRRFRRACAFAQSRQNLRCSLIQAVSQEEPSDRKPDPWPLWMAGHAQLKFVMTECSKTQIRLMGPIWHKPVHFFTLLTAQLYHNDIKFSDRQV